MTSTYRINQRISGYRNAIRIATTGKDPRDRETAAEWLRSVPGQIAAKLHRAKAN